MLRALDGLSMLCPALTEGRRRLLDEPCEHAGVTLNCVMESGDPTTFLSGIRAGIGSSRSRSTSNARTLEKMARLHPLDWRAFPFLRDPGGAAPDAGDYLTGVVGHWFDLGIAASQAKRYSRRWKGAAPQNSSRWPWRVLVV